MKSRTILLKEGTEFGFVIGSMKSGTTWLMKALGRLPRVVAHGEMHALEILNDFPTLQSTLEDASELNKWLQMPNNGWNQPFRNDLDTYCAEMRRDIFRYTYERVLQRFILENNLTNYIFVIDKNPIHTIEYYHNFIEYFHPYNPFLIHIIRDPRDVAISSWYHFRNLQHTPNQSFIHPTFENKEDEQRCAELFSMPESELSRETHFFTKPHFLRDVLNSWANVNSAIIQNTASNETRYIRVKYEKLLEDGAQELATIISQIGLEKHLPKNALIDFDAIFSHPSVKRPRTFRRGTSGQWKKWLNDGDQDLCMELCGETMKNFDYL